MPLENPTPRKKIWRGLGCACCCWRPRRPPARGGTATGRSAKDHDRHHGRRRSHQRADRHERGARAPARRKLPIRERQRRRRRPALRGWRRQDPRWPTTSKNTTPCSTKPSCGSKCPSSSPGRRPASGSTTGTRAKKPSAPTTPKAPTTATRSPYIISASTARRPPTPGRSATTPKTPGRPATEQ